MIAVPAQCDHHLHSIRVVFLWAANGLDEGLARCAGLNSMPACMACSGYAWRAGFTGASLLLH